MLQQFAAEVRQDGDMLAACWPLSASPKCEKMNGVRVTPLLRRLRALKRPEG
jgi:hypothetical protein